MALKTETKNIDGMEVVVTQLPVMRATPLMARIAKAIAPALAKLKAIDIGPSLATADADMLIPAFGEMLVRLDEAELMIIARGVLSSATVIVDGKRLALQSDEMINAAFEGKMTAFFSVLRFALEVNFRDFFAGAIAETARRRAASVSAAQTPTAVEANAST